MSDEKNVYKITTITEGELMRGHSRIRKKLLKKAGWRVTEDDRQSEKTYRLVLENQDGTQKIIEAPTKPKAYFQAEQQILQDQEE